MKSEELTFKIRGAIFEVYREVGPGLLESYYEHALTLELEDIGCKVSRQVPIVPSYKGQPMELGYRLDMLVDNEVVIEVKSVEHFHDVHKKQLLTYLKLANKPVGIMVNFNVAKMENKVSLIRIVN